MKKMTIKQRQELLKACGAVLPGWPEQVRSYLFARDELLVKAFDCLEKKVDFDFMLNGEVLETVPFSKLKPVPKPLPVTKPREVTVSKKQVDSVAVPEKKKGRGKGKNPSKSVTSVALDEELIAALNERAEREERTVSALIRLAIKHYLECVK